MPQGSLVALLGPSGGGKSTLLRVVAGLEVPDRGTIHVDGRDMTNVPVRERGVGFCFQHYAPFRHLSVRRNVAFGLEVRRLPKPAIKRRVDELLELVKIAHVADRYPAQLSGGQRQRMALARALAIEPSVLLLDEPFGALDAQVRQQLRVWLRDLHEKIPVTTLLVTHDQEEAMEIADGIAIINDGKLEQVGSPAELYDTPANRFVLEFLGPATYLDGEPVRPHDLVLHRAGDAPANGRAARVRRVTHLGFEVRIDVHLENGDDAWVQLSRGQARELAVVPGDDVWVTPTPARRAPPPAAATPPDAAATPAGAGTAAATVADLGAPLDDAETVPAVAGSSARP